MVQLITPTIRAPRNTELTGITGLGDAVARIGENRTRQNDLAAVRELAQQGASTEELATALTQSKDVTLATLGLQTLQKERARQGDRAFAQEGRDQRQANFERQQGLAEEKFDFTQKQQEFENNLKELELEVDKRGGFKDAKQVADVESGLRKEFTGISKDFRKVRDAHSRVIASGKDPSAAGDLALIFNYMKILDPGSVVRESEFATAANSAGVPDRVRNIYNRVLSGERLGRDQRKDFLDRATKLFDRQNAQHNKLVEQFSGIAERKGLDVRNVIPDFSVAGENDIPTMQTPEEASKLPSGSRFRDPEGNLRVVP